MFKQKHKKARNSNLKSRQMRFEHLDARRLMAADCVDFEDLALGTQYLNGDTFVADDTGFQAKVTLEDFEWSNGVTTSAGYAEVDNGGLAGAIGQDMQVNNTLLSFDFAEPVSGLTLRYGEYGGNLNLEINGDFFNFEDFTDIGGGTPVDNLGGVDIFVSHNGVTDRGELRLIGNVEELKIGGQELWIDALCLHTPEPQHRFDFGDAPDSYRTLLASTGPSHRIEEGVHLGRTVDAEPDGQPSANALRDDVVGGVDDEDGVKFISPLVAGSMADVEVEASVDGWLNAWVDFDQNGMFNPGEKIFDAQPVVAGVNVLSFSIPAGAVTDGLTHTRWRFSTEAKSLPYHGDLDGLRSVNGEVEDHVWRFQDQEHRFDFGDAPDSYRTLLASTGPSHRIEEGIHLGRTVDAEPDGQPSADAMRDDVVGGVDDEDGVKFISPLVAGNMADVEVEASVDGWLNAWVDFDQNGMFDAGEKIFDAQPVFAGVNVLSFSIPAGAVTDGLTHTRWRFSTEAKSLPYHGDLDGLRSVNGEVEDHVWRFQDQEHRFDFGDAPDSYRTLLASTGPSHRIEEGVHLGRTVDAEPDGQPSADALRDDAVGGVDDEDGVKFITPLVAGNMADVEVEASVDGWLNAWVDFDGNGMFDAGEKIFHAQPVFAGTNVLSFSIPAGAVTNELTHSRWRFSTDAMGLPFHGDLGGRSVNGEVEDHALRIQEDECFDVFFPGEQLAADINDDGVVDSQDLGLLLNEFGAAGDGMSTDLNGDSVVDSTDLGLLLNDFGKQEEPGHWEEVCRGLAFASFYDAGDDADDHLTKNVVLFE